ncbi:MAG TPA: UDP-glucose/GDP-mannose dehydrogenase family protein [Deltaproteobacteria bacterium]|nr:UDP-glucose/GDP-mannose dehydrogenase family protein [Deltaproteobacteria bacterium]
MKICVQGLWHLGSVTAACLASVGHDVVGLDGDSNNISNLNQGKAPLFEPGLDEMIQNEINEGHLRFAQSSREAVADAELLWVTFDTPVDEEDHADVEFVLGKIKSVLPELNDGTVVLISSQIPVGSIKKLEHFVKDNYIKKQICFAYSPENLRLGKSIDVFLNPDRIVVGTRNDETKEKLKKLFSPITNKIEWMSVESAEMTKHAINAFLATSVTFANELAAICELYGADAKEVERGLKTESRIGPRAYLSPGGPFAGGTLARDIDFLDKAAQEKALAVPLLQSVRVSNNEHKKWTKRKLSEKFTPLNKLSVAIWGLTYKPETSTLRRSLAVALCDWLIEEGAIVHVYDPAVQKLPSHWNNHVDSFNSALEALKNTQVLVLGTEWAEFKETAKKMLEVVNNDYLVIDANRYLQNEIFPLGINYIAVGMPATYEGE